MTPVEALQFAKENGARQVDVRFSDIPGLQHHISYPIGELSEGSFTDGFGIDGSSIRGWAAINESDMLLIPGFRDGVHGPVHGDAHAGDDRRCARSSDQAELRARPALDREESRALSAGIPAPATPRSSAPKPSFSFSTTSASTRTRIRVFTSSMPTRAAGIRAARRTIWVTVRATKKATSRCRRPIITRICARKW